MFKFLLPARIRNARLFRAVKRFKTDKEGATAVEFSMVAVPFLGLLFAIFETALLFFTIQGVEAATAEASRMIMTGQAQANGSVTAAEQFRTNYLCSPAPPAVRILPAYIDCSKVIVDVRTAASFASAPLSNSFITDSTHQYCTGNKNQIVVLRVAYPMPVFTAVLAMNNLGAGGTYVHTGGKTNFDGGMKHIIVATSAFRNEPFPDVTPLTGC